MLSLIHLLLLKGHWRHFSIHLHNKSLATGVGFCKNPLVNNVQTIPCNAGLCVSGEELTKFFSKLREFIIKDDLSALYFWGEFYLVLFFENYELNTKLTSLHDHKK